MAAPLDCRRLGHVIQALPRKGLNPGPPLVTRVNVAQKLPSLGSGFRRNDELHATFP